MAQSRYDRWRHEPMPGIWVRIFQGERNLWWGSQHCLRSCGGCDTVDMTGEPSVRGLLTVPASSVPGADPREAASAMQWRCPSVPAFRFQCRRCFPVSRHNYCGRTTRKERVSPRTAGELSGSLFAIGTCHDTRRPWKAAGL